jgi:hypothetical protein
MYARLLGFLPILLLQPPADLPEGPRPVRIFMLVLTHLGVREPAPLRDEDRVPPEPPNPPRLRRDLSRDLSLENTHIPAGVRNRDRADGACRAVLAGEHPQDALVADAEEEPLGQRPWQAVPGPDDEPRVLDEDRVRRRAKGLAGDMRLVDRYLAEVEGLYLGDILGPQGGVYELDPKYPLCLAALVLVGGHEEDSHGAEVYNPCALYDTVAPMQEVRVESLDGLEVRGSELRLSANAGSLSIVFPREVWDHVLMSAEASEEPDAVELEELYDLKETLKAHAAEQAFEIALDGVGVGEPGLDYDLVLRPGGLLAVTTGYLFAPVVERELMVRIGACLARDRLVEQAYAIGAVASEEALAAGDDNLKALSVRGRRCSTSRFEMAPELWQVLAEGLGWDNVETFVNDGGV